MNENLKPNESAQKGEEPEIITNDYGKTVDNTVVVEEANRTVLLTDNETIVIEKEPRIDVVPKNRLRKVYTGMWGTPEIITVGLGMLAILTSVLLFVLVVLPAQKELQTNQTKRNELETELLSSRKNYGDITNTETQVAKILTSIDDFETRFLPNATIGRTALYQRLNGLIAAYGLVNTSGPDYAPLEINARSNNGQTENERGRAKFQSLFPGVYVTTTVEGTYQNLRQFIRQIETSDQFVVISAIEIEPAESEEKNNPNNGTTQAQVNPPQMNPQMNPQPNRINPNIQNFPNNQPRINSYENQPPIQTQPQTSQVKVVRGKTHGEIVALRIEMAAYFRRPNYQPVTETVNTSVTIQK